MDFPDARIEIVAAVGTATDWDGDVYNGPDRVFGAGRLRGSLIASGSSLTVELTAGTFGWRPAFEIGVPGECHWGVVTGLLWFEGSRRTDVWTTQPWGGGGPGFSVSSPSHRRIQGAVTIIGAMLPRDGAEPLYFTELRGAGGVRLVASERREFWLGAELRVRSERDGESFSTAMLTGTWRLPWQWLSDPPGVAGASARVAGGPP